MQNYVVTFQLHFGYIVVSAVSHEELSPAFDTEKEAREYLDFYFKH